MQLVAQREVHRPVVRSERERVQVVRRVDARTGVAVLPPGAADGGRSSRSIVNGMPGALEVDRRADPGHAGADDEHLEPVRHVDRLDVRLAVQADLGRLIISPYSSGTSSPIATPSISTSIAGDGSGMATGRPSRQARMASSAASRISCWRARAARRCRCRPCPRAGRAVRLLQPLRLAGELHEHHQQRGDVGDGDRLGEGVVGRVRRGHGSERTQRGSGRRCRNVASSGWWVSRPCRSSSRELRSTSLNGFVGVEARLAGQAEDALADAVALHLVGAGGDGDLTAVEVVDGRLLGVVVALRPGQRLAAADLQREAGPDRA